MPDTPTQPVEFGAYFPSIPTCPPSTFNHILVAVGATDPKVVVNYLTSGVAGLTMNWEAKPASKGFTLTFKAGAISVAVTFIEFSLRSTV